MRQLILPGGKIEKRETRIAALRRELKEELQVSVRQLRFIGKFSGFAAEKKERLAIYLYSGIIVGKPKPASEITGIKWCDSASKSLSQIVKKQIMPYLASKGKIN